MATILPFPNAKVVPVWGLTQQECDAVNAAAFPLIQAGQSTGVSVHNNRQYMCVFDCRGEPYFVGREGGICYLFDVDESLLAQGEAFEIVVNALIKILSPTPYTPA